MEYLKVLTPEELVSIQKFQEFGQTIPVGYGNKATWGDLVHQDVYSDAVLTTELGKLKQKKNNEDQLEDEDMNTPGYNRMFSQKTGDGERVEFLTQDCINMLRGARKVRKFFKESLENKEKELTLLKEIEKLEKRTTSPSERLVKAQAELAALKGGTPVIVSENETNK